MALLIEQLKLDSISEEASSGDSEKQVQSQEMPSLLMSETPSSSQYKTQETLMSD